MPLAKPLYLTTDFSDLTPHETMRVRRSAALHEYSISEVGKRNTRSNTLMSSFGISLKDYEVLLKEQDSKCAICRSSQNGKSGTTRSFAVDHNHETGEIRGLLCDFCNRSLGNFKDDVEVLRSAIDYLRKPPVRALKESGYEFGKKESTHHGRRRSPKERLDVSTKDIIDFYNASIENSLRKTAKSLG